MADDTVIVRDTIIEILTVGSQGPAGPPTLSAGAIITTEGDLVVGGVSGVAARFALANQGVVNVKLPHFGALGDGVTDDTTAFHAARDSGAKHVYVPKGTYVAAATLNVNGQTWEIDPGATILATPGLGANAAAVTVTANDVRIIGGGSIDGNRANQTLNTVNALRVTGDRATVEDLTIPSCKGIGLYLKGGTGHRVRHIRTFDTGHCGFYAEASGKHMDDCFFEDIVCDRSAETAGYLEGACKFIGSATYQIRRPVIDHVSGILPNPASVDGTSANSNVATEFFYIEDGRLDDIHGYGGWIAVSFGYVCKRLAVGAVVGNQARYGGIELAGAGSTGVDNSFGSMRCNGGGITQRPIQLSTFDGTTIGQMTVIDGGVNDGGNLGYILYVVSCDNLTINSCKGRMGSATGTGGGLLFQTSSHIRLLGPEVSEGAGVTVGAGLTFDRCDDVTVFGGSSDGIASDIAIYAFSAGLLDNYLVQGFRFGMGVLYPLTASGGGTSGNNIRFIGCPGLVRNGRACDIVDYKADVLQCFDVGSPESVVVAGIGSIYQRRNGAAGTTFWVKESGTGNTGWIGK